MIDTGLIDELEENFGFPKYGNREKIRRKLRVVMLDRLTGVDKIKYQQDTLNEAEEYLSRMKEVVDYQLDIVKHLKHSLGMKY